MADFTVSMGLVGAGATALGIQSIINLGQQATAVLREQARAASEYASVTSSHIVNVREADEATAALIDTVELHRNAAKLEQAQLYLTAQEFRALSVAAAEYAQRTGEDITESFNRLTNGVITAGEEVRRFGIYIQEGGTQQERQRRIIEQLTASYADQTVEVRNTHEAISALENAWGTAWAEMLNVMENTEGPIRSIITGLTEALNDFASAFATHRAAMAGERAQWLAHSGYGPDGQPLPGAAAAIRRQMQEAMLLAQDPSGRAAAAHREAVQRVARDLAEQQRREAEGPGTPGEVIALGGIDITGTTTRGGGGGRRVRPEAAMAQATAQWAAQMHQDYLNRLDAEYAKLRIMNEAQQALNRERAEWLVQWEENQDAHRRDIAIEWLERQREQVELLTAEYEKLLDAQERHIKEIGEAASLQSQYMSIGQQTLTGITDAVRDYTDAQYAVAEARAKAASTEEESDRILEEAQKKRDRQNKAFMIAEGTVLVALNASKGATEVALAISDSTRRAQHIAAAVAHFAAMGIAAAKLGTKVAATKLSAQTFPEKKEGDAARTGPATIIHFHGPVTSRRVYENLQTLENQSQRY